MDQEDFNEKQPTSSYSLVNTWNLKKNFKGEYPIDILVKLKKMYITNLQRKNLY